MGKEKREKDKQKPSKGQKTQLSRIQFLGTWSFMLVESANIIDVQWSNQ